ncbi:hypothetical protein H4R33_006136 [Dimargaris cristalligena]|uniref:WD40-repeat-containing domain protein n=1 Tax=Dimargaris cristalligena TaxID=215637 RepID=A0A4Q0A0G7_9FUNG|nr:hypothetical protein H4R33_006136 [Dimargaris cristalligena]RKP38921.1 WD40-repeat-containing domain protein [Dimargaris cristalligena]|eukprot:RKP38921.1 WD40-repeat-containing domain protein [Dimargaris cristalligena]
MTKVPYTERGSVFINRTKEYTLKSTAQHWQLQDCVVCPESQSEVYYLNDYRVQKFNQVTQQVETTPHKFDFKSVSLNVGYGYSVTSGESSEISIYDSYCNQSRTHHIGKDINNHLSFNYNPIYLPAGCRPPSEPHLLACNNDGNIRVLSLPDLRIIKKIPMLYSVNYASVSPDGRKMVVVTDDQAVKLFDVRGSTYTPVQSFNTFHNASYSCNWNQLSDMFAVATADGFIDIFDIRSQKKFREIRSTQHPRTGGACRVVKFSPGYSTDLMVFSEQTNYINVIDTRNFEDIQRIRVAPDGQKITGFSFTPDCNSLYVGIADRLTTFAVNQTSRRCFGSWDIV